MLLKVRRLGKRKREERNQLCSEMGIRAVGSGEHGNLDCRAVYIHGGKKSQWD